VKTAPGGTPGRMAGGRAATNANPRFVRLMGDAWPEIKHAAYTNFCDIGWNFDAASRRLVLIAVLDNLVKGAAGQAIQNFNLIHDFDERTALL